ncbi:MAG: hypothetical protein K0S29_913 [Gammaproteobacteria bacterium]|jgi:antirestriction protein|nr:hypothetical protein [Gammaproteobacteria bacterium]
MSNNNLEPKIYVACLAAYNDGYLHGAWIDASQDIENIYTELKAMLASSPAPDAEEWAIHDYEDFGDIKIEEYTSIKTVKALTDFITAHGELGTAAYGHYGSIEALENYYYGEHESEIDFAEQLFDGQPMRLKFRPWKKVQPYISQGIFYLPLQVFYRLPCNHLLPLEHLFHAKLSYLE